MAHPNRNINFHLLYEAAPESTKEIAIVCEEAMEK